MLPSIRKRTLLEANQYTVHFAPWYRNQMTVEFSEDLKDELTLEKTGLQIPATFCSSQELEKNYLNRPYGNAYDFNQVDKIEGIF